MNKQHDILDESNISEVIQKALDFDPIAVGENLSDNLDEQAHLALGLLGLNAEHKKKLMLETNDTPFGCLIDDWLKVVKSLGFKIVVTLPIPETKDNFYVLWRQDGLLISCDSYSFDKNEPSSINRANMYFNCIADHFPNHCSGCLSQKKLADQKVYLCSIDAREAIRHNLSQLEKEVRFLPQWIEQPFIWLLHYKDTKQSYDYEAINQTRIKMLPESIQKAITPQ